MSAPTDSERHLAEIHTRLEGIGLSPSARDWLIKALHPAATHECPGVPDPFEGQLVTPDYRDSMVVGPAATVTGDWDCLVIQTPGDVNGFAVATGPSGTDFNVLAGIAPPVNCTVAATVNQPCINGPGATVLTYTGNPAVPASAVRGTIQQVSEPWAWRRRYAGITAYMTASALNDQGTVFASSFASGYQSGQAQFIGINTADLYAAVTTSGLALVKTHEYNVPLDETALQLLSPKPYVAPARHGVYIPARFTGFDLKPVEMYTSREPIATTQNSVSFLAPSGNAADNVPGVVVPRFTNSQERVAWPSHAFTSPSTQAGGVSQLDSGHSDMTVQVAIFRGLANGARITVRSYFGLEVVPRVSSTFRQFAKPAPPYSELALRTYSAVIHEMAYCYPASFNSWGDLLSVIHKVASFIYPAVRPLLSSIPIVGPAVRQLADAVVPRKSHPSMSEVQRVAVSDPRPPPKPALVARVRSASRTCQQCVLGVRHKHKLRSSSVVSDRKSVV